MAAAVLELPAEAREAPAILDHPGAAGARHRSVPLEQPAAQHPRTLPMSSSVAVWLAAFVSPTVYFLLLILANRSRVPAPPAILVVSLFCLIPLVALLICGSVAWRSNLERGWRVGWLVLTVLGMLLQCGVLLVIIISAITVAISPAQ